MSRQIYKKKTKNKLLGKTKQIRLGVELHKSLKILSAREGKTIRQIVEESLALSHEF